jgi:Flp pilus assembly protein TadD
MICISFAGCAAFTLAPDRASTPARTEPATAKLVKAEPPAAAPAKAEPAVNAESRQMYQQALTALRAGRYPEAERVLLAVIRREPELAGPRANLGILYARTGRPAQALESLQQATRLNPDRAAYYNELGMISRREGRFDEARRYYTKALDLDPNYAYAHLNIGILYDLYSQDAAKAMHHYQRYRELVPGEAGTVTKWIADLQQRGRATEQAKGGKSG